MTNLFKSTQQADSVREACTCVQDCHIDGCAQMGKWHSHLEDACPVHPSPLVE